MSALNLFITATDTDAGKTYISVQLAQEFIKKGCKVAVYKPIAAGCNTINGELQNEDALLLQQAANCQQSYSSINPIAFEAPIAPHIAAKLSGMAINAEAVLSGYKELSGEINIIEGAGGWRLPLGDGKYLSDLVKVMAPSVILVVNMKLGCLNHAVLTYQSIISDGLTCAGWIANNQENMPFLAENIAELTSLLDAPCLAAIDINGSVTAAAEQLLKLKK
ncbi:MAG: dethiobiotin synthase [Thalassotalea sp.]